MTILQYLEERASKLRLEVLKRTQINASLSNLTSILRNNLNDKGLTDIRIFGSFARDTQLPRSIDSNSDVDIMVVFGEFFANHFQPQTYVERIRRVIEPYYSRSISGQDWPAFTLQLGFINYDLVPALHYFGEEYQIPASHRDLLNWIPTNPDQLNRNVQQSNSYNDYYVKKVIRLLKYWNIQNGRPLSTYQLEQQVSSLSYIWDTNLQDYLKTAVSGLWSNDEDGRKKINDLRNRLDIANEWYKNGFKEDALRWYQGLFGKI